MNNLSTEDLDNLLTLLQSYKYLICDKEEQEKNNKDITEVKAMLEEMRIIEKMRRGKKK